MEQRISLITLGVDDLARSTAFYAALGWRGQEVEETVFFQAGGMALVLWGQALLAADTGVEESRFAPGAAVVLAQNVRSSAAVDEILATAEQAGGVITKSAQTTFYGGYAGCFADPDGHCWEIAHNPGFRLADDGSLELPDFAAGSDQG